MEHASVEIPIDSSEMAGEQLLTFVAPAFKSSGAVRLELRPVTSQMRSPVVDSSVLVAVVAGGSAALSALVSGLLKVLEKRRDNTAKVVIRGSNGATIEFPADTPPEALPRLVEFAKSLDDPRIELALMTKGRG